MAQTEKTTALTMPAMPPADSGLDGADEVEDEGDGDGERKEEVGVDPVMVLDSLEEVAAVVDEDVLVSVEEVDVDDG